MIDTEVIEVTTSGSDGSATGSATSVAVNGELLAVHIAPSAGQAATVDVTVKTVAPELTLLTASNVSAAGWYYPRVQVQDGAGAGVTYDGTNEVYAPMPIDDGVTVSAAQGDDGETVTVTLKVRR